MEQKQTTIIEVNGVKLEVDLRTARRIDNLQVGSRVKCLVKHYQEWKTHAGVVVGFEPFPTKPSIIVAYVESDYSGAGLTFRSFNADTKDFEIIADLDQNALEVDRANILTLFDREISKKEMELKEVKEKRQFFLDKFRSYFSDAQEETQ